MGFGGVGLRSVGSRHLRNYAVVNRVLGSDSVTTTKIAPETIIEIDIAPLAVGSSEIAPNAISYIDQIKDNIIGSRHLGPDSIYGVKILDNEIGFGKLTTGLQGSLGVIPPDSVGTTELKEPGVDFQNIYNVAVGSEHIADNGISYDVQIKDAIIPETKFQLHFEHGSISIPVGGTYVYFSTAFGAIPDISIAQIGSNYGVYITDLTTGYFGFLADSYPARASWLAWGSR